MRPAVAAGVGNKGRLRGKGRELQSWRRLDLSRGALLLLRAACVAGGWRGSSAGQVRVRAGRRPAPAPGSLPPKPSPACGARPTPAPCQATAFTCVFQCFPCDPSCGSASWATPEFTQRSVAPMVKMTRSKTFQAYLPSCHRTYSCIHCRAHLANHDELISKSFQGSQGRAYLFNSVVNVGCGPAEERVLLTGLHAVADIYCENCKTTLGWKYEHAFESSQKYKEGKYIIELAHMIKDNGWD
ncbi:protein yippee-like 2 [Zootoca vivipara]|uniref:protein yippee-like 2 n=1 Tax=Zootoca vivipara TaxID=8524 RepID=UPI00293B9CF0|nr:protein yippee-like 2 [Zootoca vivipara]